MKNALDQIYDYIDQHFDEHLAAKSSKCTQQTIIHLTMAGDDLDYRAPKTRLVLDK